MNALDRTVATHEEIRCFWADVRCQDAARMAAFLRQFVDTLGYWREPMNIRPFAQVVYDNTGLCAAGGDLYALRGGAQGLVARAPIAGAVLFLHGCEFDMRDMGDVLQAVYGDCAGVMGGEQYEKLLRRTDAWMQRHVDRCELALVACAQTRNLEGFRRALSASGMNRRGMATVFDNEPQRAPGMTVLQAIMLWEDPKVRSGLLAHVLPKCTLAYMLLECPAAAVPHGDTLPVPVLAALQTRTVFEEAAAVPDPDALQVLLNELTRFGALQEEGTQRVLASALMLCGKLIGYTGDASAAMDEVVVKLCAHMRVDSVAQCYSSMSGVFEGAVVRTRVRYADDRAHLMMAQTDVASTTLTRTIALCASMVKHARDAALTDVVLRSKRTRDESQRFNAAFSKELQTVEHAHALQEEVALLRLRTQVLTDVVTKQARVLHYVQDQLRHASSPSSRASAETGGSAFKSDAQFTEFLEAMDAIEADLLCAQMPSLEGLKPLGTGSPAAPASSLETLEQRFQSIRGTPVDEAAARLQTLQAQVHAVRIPVGMLA